MKITKKQPLRPRGRSEDKRQSTKNVIRDAYINGPQKEVQIIPAKRDMEAETEKKKLRVCAYCRVSTDEDTQASSYELQVQNYTRMIRENPEWEFAGIFADEGISGTSVLHREHFLEMIEKCKAGEIDLIITKQVSRFARNVLDSLNYIFMLRKLDPPVGVYFETEKLNTLDKSSDMVITVLSLVAQSESEQKSNSLKWSFKRRRAQGLGIYPSWALLGYRLDDEKNWEIVEDEADIVRTIHNPLTVAIGDSEEMQKAIDMLSEVKESIINAYEIKTGLSRAKLSHLMDAETWMNANKAVELGFADDLLFKADGESAAAEDSFVFSRRAVTNSLMSKVKSHHTPSELAKPAGSCRLH